MYFSLKILAVGKNEVTGCEWKVYMILVKLSYSEVLLSPIVLDSKMYFLPVVGIVGYTGLIGLWVNSVRSENIWKPQVTDIWSRITS